MDWLEVEWEQERPSDSAALRVWQSVEVQPVEEVPLALTRYLDELRRIYSNGGAEYAQFLVAGNPDFDWFAARNRWAAIRFFVQFLSHIGVRTTLPEVTEDALLSDALKFHWESSLTLDGELAKTLLAGGAYTRFDSQPRDAKRLGIQVCEALFGDRYLEVEVFRCRSAWSNWFEDVAWDNTLILIDRRFQTVSLLVSTDTD